MPAGNGVIGALLVSVGADTAAFQKGLKEATDKSKSFGATVGRIGATVGVAMAAGAAAGGAALISFGMQALSAADDIGDAAARIGTTTTEFQKLQYAFVQAGGSSELMTTAMDKLNQNLGAAKLGSKGMIDAFAQLGLNANSFATADQAFYAIADAIQNIKDPAERARMSMEFFGRTAGVDMVEVLGKSGVEMRRLAQEAQNLGIVMSEETTAKLADAKLALDKAKFAASAMATAFAGEALVSIIDFAKEMQPMFDKVKQVATQIWDFLEPSIKELGAAIGELAASPYMKMLLEGLGVMARIAGTVLVGAFRLLIDSFSAGIRSITAVANAWAEMVTKIRQHFAFLEPVFNKVKEGVAAVSHAFWELEDKVTGHSYVPDMVDEIARQFARLPNVMTDKAVSETQKTADAFRNLQQATEGLMTSQERAIVELSDTLAAFETDEAKRTLSEKDRLDLKTRAWNRYWEAVGGAGITLGQGKELNIPNVPDLPNTDWIKGASDGLADQIAANDNMRNAFAKSFSEGAMQGLDGDFGEWFKKKLQSWAFDGFSKAMENLGGAIFDAMKGGSGSGGGIGGVLASIGSAIFGGKRAGGGSVSAGKIYQVNENTPNTEYFMPRTDGAIWNPAQLGALASKSGGQGGGFNGNVVVYIGNEQLEGRMYKVATDVTGAAVGGLASQQQKSVNYNMNRSR